MQPKPRLVPESLLQVSLVAATILVAAALVPYLGAQSWIISLAVGSGLILYGARSLRHASRVMSWPGVPARVLSAEMGVVATGGRSGGYLLYYPVVRFEYLTVRGPVVSDRFTISPRDYLTADRDETQRLLDRYPSG